MQYQITGEPLPVVICNLQPGETMISEAGGMAWMSPNMKMETIGGGIGKMFGRAMSGENMFQNHYTAMGGPGMIAFTSSFPGTIRAIPIAPGRDIIVQKSAFLASESGVELSMHFRKKVAAGLFGGEGFIMQKLSGQGMAFIEIDGTAVEYVLAPGQQMIVDTGNVAMIEASVQLDVVTVPGVKNIVFGGEGLFNTVLTGPGRIVLQTMPVSALRALIAPASGS